jgi:hypothetical protein
MTRLERAFKVVGVQIDNPAGVSGPNRNEPVALLLRHVMGRA